MSESTKQKTSWHNILPNIISHGVDTTRYDVGTGQLKALMMQFRQGYVEGNWGTIEVRCFNMARALNRVRPPGADLVEDSVWFMASIRALRHSRFVHTKRARATAIEGDFRDANGTETLLGKSYNRHR